MKKSFGVAAIIVVVLGGYFLYSKSFGAKNQVQYITSTAEKGTLVSSVSASGNIIIDQSATVSPTISGTVTGLSVKVGDSVKEGDFLFKIENDQLGVSVAKSLASYKSAKNALKSAQLQRKQAVADLNDAKDKNKTTSQTPSQSTSQNTGTDHNNTGATGTTTQPSTAQNPSTDDSVSAGQVKVLEEKVKLADSSINVAEENLNAALADYNNQKSIAGERSVAAPISGIINEVNIKNGDDLGNLSSSNSSSMSSSSSTSNNASGTNQSPIIIGDLETLKAQVQVNEVDIPKVKAGQKATLKFDALENLSVTGKVEKIDALGTNTQGVVTYNVTIELTELDAKIKPGMSVSASIITKVNQDTITIPNSALKSDDNNGYYAQILVGQTPQNRQLEIGAANNKETEILSGIDEGDKVITQTIDPNASTTSSTGGFSMPGTGRMSGGGAARGGFMGH